MLLIVFILICATPVLTISCDQNDCTEPSPIESLPLTNETINILCGGYQNYKTCMDSWKNRCMENNKINDFVNMLEKDTKLYASLCMMESFRKEYIHETPSLAKISDDWKKCQETYTKAMNETHKEDDIIEACCMKKAYHDCMEPLCDSKCTGSGKSLYKKIFEMSMERTESMNCDNISYADHCKSGVIKNGVIKNGLNPLVLNIAIIYSTYFKFNV